jgi:hypothetical protein
LLEERVAVGDELWLGIRREEDLGEHGSHR